MSHISGTVEELMRELPPEAQAEVRDFAEFLRQKNARKGKGEAKFKWAGVARDLRDKYTSVQLQHRISEWRIGADEASD
jgi:hypothetical protein